MPCRRFGSCTTTWSGITGLFGYEDCSLNWQRLTRTHKRLLLLKHFLCLVNRGLLHVSPNSSSANTLTSGSRILVGDAIIPTHCNGSKQTGYLSQARTV